MKKTVLRSAALVLTLVMLLCLAGCSIDLNDMLIVKRAYKHISEMDSLSFTAHAEMDAVAGALPMKISADADCHCIIDPTTFQIAAGFDLGKLGKIELPMYMFVKDNALQVLMGMGQAGNTVWVSNSFPITETEEDEDGSEITVESVLNMLQNDPEALVVGESETVNGVVCRPFVLKVPGQVLMDMLDTKAPEGSGFVIEDTLLTIWISEEDGMPVRMSADLASLLQYIADVADAAYLPKLKIKSLPVTVDKTGYNDVESIALPNAA